MSIPSLLAQVLSGLYSETTFVSQEQMMALTNDLAYNNTVKEDPHEEIYAPTDTPDTPPRPVYFTVLPNQTFDVFSDIAYNKGIVVDEGSAIS